MEVIRALIAGRAALVAIPIGLGLWAVIGLAVTLAGASLGHHAHLTEWGIALMAAALIGAATGLPLATRRRRPSPGQDTASTRQSPGRGGGGET